MSSLWATVTSLHLANIFDEAPKPRETPSAIILSIGINSRDNKLKTHRDQLKRLALTSSRLFPNAEIYIPQINYSHHLSDKQKASLDSINTIALEIAGTYEQLSTLPTLPRNLFETGTDNIHWTNDTANGLISHWLGHLNL